MLVLTVGELWRGDERGVIPRAIEELLAAAPRHLHMQCLQLYGEELSDLLGTTHTVLKLRENKAHEVHTERLNTLQAAKYFPPRYTQRAPLRGKSVIYTRY